MYKKKNFMMSITIRPNEICKGPKYGFTEKMYTSFKELHSEETTFILSINVRTWKK